MTDQPGNTAPSIPSGTDSRVVILHYHLFKNAGTSIDKTLEDNFGADWTKHEVEQGDWQSEDVEKYLLKRPGLRALSSHTALLPLPDLGNRNIFPIVFLRHPIDRIGSIYRFERQQKTDNIASRMAKNFSLREYVKWRLANSNDRSIQNFQSYRLSLGTPHTGPADHNVTELYRAEQTLKNLPFVGVVECFPQSFSVLRNQLSELYPEFSFKPYHLNRTRTDRKSLEGRLSEIREQLGDELYTKIIIENSFDIHLHNIAIQRICADFDCN